MKNPLRIFSAVLLLTAMSLLPAFAQEVIGTLQVDGTVMTSTGGDFVTAASGQAVQAGTRLMVADGGSASITFQNGAVAAFTEPGVYTVNMPVGLVSGSAASPVGSASVIAANAGFIGFAAVIAASGIASSTLDETEDLVGDPISR